MDQIFQLNQHTTGISPAPSTLARFGTDKKPSHASEHSQSYRGSPPLKAETSGQTYSETAGPQTRVFTRAASHAPRDAPEPDLP
jgi:hypothetical protein